MSGLGSMFGRQSPMADSPSHSSIHGVRRGTQQRRGVTVSSSKEVAPILGDEVKPETALAKATPVRDAVRKLLNAKPKPEAPISYAQLLEYLQNKRIVRLSIHDHGKEAIAEVCIPGYEDESEEAMELQIFNCMLPGDYHEEVLKLAKEANAKNAGPERGNCVCQFYYVDPAKMAPPIVGELSYPMIPIVGFWAFQAGMELISFLRRGGQPKKSSRRKLAEAFGSTRATKLDAKQGVKFEDVAGVDHAVTMFQEIIDIMLGDPRYAGIGAVLPKGVLLEGPPGTGKTLLAKAVSGEAGVPFFSANGSEFVEMFVGVAAARVRDLFKKARESTPAIIFIDEIDTIGRARGNSQGADNDEREQGLMQLLVEMDGFDTKQEKVLVIGATNLRSTLDPALLRAGRFDRVVRLGLPNELNRLKILQVHGRGKLIPTDGDEEFEDNALLRRTAQLTVGYSGAELANLLNEAAIIAVRRNKEFIGLEELETGMEKMKLGLPRPPLAYSEEKRHLAYVEAGRAVLITAFTPLVPNVLQVSVAPRGNRTSRVATVPLDRDRVADMKDLEDYVDLMALTLAGRATEEMVFGRMGVTLITSNELSTATELAVRLVSQSGLHPDFKNVYLQEDDLLRYPITRDKVDKAVGELTETAYNQAKQLVMEHMPAIEVLVNDLMEKDTIYGSRLREIVAKTPKAVVVEAAPSLPAAGSLRSPAMGTVSFTGLGTGRVTFGHAATGASSAMRTKPMAQASHPMDAEAEAAHPAGSSNGNGGVKAAAGGVFK